MDSQVDSQRLTSACLFGLCGLWLLAFIVLPGLSGSQLWAQSKAKAPSPREAPQLVIYSSQKEHILRELLGAYTEDTGVRVQLVYDQAGPLLTKLRAEGTSSPADVLLAIDAGNLWLASRQNLLRSLDSKLLQEGVPVHLRDPQGAWFGLSKRVRSVVYNPDLVDPKDLGDYEDLALPKWKGKLCLRTSQHVYNQSLVAVLLESWGEERTLKMLRGWVSNLAAPVFANDTQMLQAVARGQCQVGISNSYYLARLLNEQPDLKVRNHWPHPVHVNVFGGGVTRSSRQAELAQSFLEWLVSERGQQLIAGANFEYPVRASVQPAEVVRGWGQFEAFEVNLSVAGERQSAAVRLMDRARFR